MLSARREAEGEQLAGALRDEGFTVGFVPADVMQRDQVANAVDRTVQRFGRIDILANCFSFDYLCRGEGEDAILDLVKAIEQEDPYRPVPNLWIKRNGHVMKSEVRSLVQDLDTLPFVDRAVYFKYRVVQDFHMDHFSFITGRGCPFSCSFC